MFVFAQVLGVVLSPPPDPTRSVPTGSTLPQPSPTTEDRMGVYWCLSVCARALQLRDAATAHTSS